jgi:translation initiation factor IF-2
MLGIQELLEAIQVQYEILELKARTEGRAKGVVVEAHLDKGRGNIATMMVTEGTLRVGDFIVVGKVFGRVRAMIDHNGKPMKEATPSTPIGIIGLAELPMSGDLMHVVKDEKSGREVIDLRVRQEREAIQAAKVPTTLEDLLNRSAETQLPQLLLIIKADTQGSAQAIAQAIADLKSSMIKPEIIFKGVGDLTEGDLTLAETSKAAIIAFNVKVSRTLTEEAERMSISIKSFNIIYELLDSVKDLMVRKLPPIFNEVTQGHAEVRNTISVPKIGLIAGSAITDGKITRNSMLRVLRNGEVVYSGKVSSLKRFKDDVKEVVSGFECGIAIDGYRDIQIGDVLEAYMIEEKPAVLDI